MYSWICKRCSAPCSLTANLSDGRDEVPPIKCPLDGVNVKWEKVSDDVTVSETKTVAENDNVNHPSHYTTGRFETIEVIEDWGLDFCLGNAVKYISRAGKKDPSKEVEDLQKAVWYINRRLRQLEGKD